MPFAAIEVDLEVIILSEVNQRSYNTYMQNLKKMTQMNLLNRNTHRLRKWIYDCQRGRVGWGRDRLGVWDWQVHTSIFKIKYISMKKSKQKEAGVILSSRWGKWGSKILSAQGHPTGEDQSSRLNPIWGFFKDMFHPLSDMRIIHVCALCHPSPSWNL